MMDQKTTNVAYPDLPRVAVGAVVFKDNKVLLVKRAKPPAQGLWAIPGGSVELGETLQQAAERETLEETGIMIQAKNLFTPLRSLKKMKTIGPFSLCYC
jgi:ADP-ribose pyrophosphatase YjhB (NUDIX family)